MHLKTEGMTQFDIFHVFVENSVNSELCFFLNSTQMPMFEQLKKQVPMNSQQFLNPH